MLLAGLFVTLVGAYAGNGDLQPVGAIQTAVNALAARGRPRRKEWRTDRSTRKPQQHHPAPSPAPWLRRLLRTTAPMAGAMPSTPRACVS